MNANPNPTASPPPSGEKFFLTQKIDMELTIGFQPGHPPDADTLRAEIKHYLRLAHPLLVEKLIEEFQAAHRRRADQAFAE